MHSVFDEINVDKTLNIPLYRQLSSALIEIISTLPAASKLPTIRSLAKQLNVNTATVVSAYKFLETKGHVYSIVGSGVYVAQKNKIVEESILENAINFADINTDTSLFPTKSFSNASNSVLLKYAGRAFNNINKNNPLVEIFGQMYDIDALTIQITTGIHQAIHDIASNFINPGDVVLVEFPGSQAITAIFLSYGAKVIDIPLDTAGFPLEKFTQLVKQYAPKFIFLMPNFQIPTNLCYNVFEREKILEIASGAGAYIIEADSFNDFYYNKPTETLKKIDKYDIVIYIKSFSAIIASQGLGVGFIAFPRSNFNSGAYTTPTGYIQRVFDNYLRHGEFPVHAGFMRHQYKKRCAKIIEAINTYLLSFVSFNEPDGGLGLWITLKNDINNNIYKELLNRQIVVSPGYLFAPAGWPMPHFRVNFANIPEARIAEGIGTIARVLARHHS